MAYRLVYRQSPADLAPHGKSKENPAKQSKTSILAGFKQMSCQWIQIFCDKLHIIGVHQDIRQDGKGQKCRENLPVPEHQPVRCRLCGDSGVCDNKY